MAHTKARGPERPGHEWGLLGKGPPQGVWAGNGSALRFSLSQPLRVNSRAASLSLPTGRTQEGTVVGRTLSAPLIPSGRQLDLSAQLDLSGG